MNTSHSTIKIPLGGDSTAAKERAASRIGVRAEARAGRSPSRMPLVNPLVRETKGPAHITTIEAIL